MALESLLDAFLRPAFEVTHGDRNELFNCLRARVAIEHSALTREIVSRAFDENDGIFVAELAATLPQLTQEDLHWRFHFLVGAMIYTMSDSGQLEGLSEGRCSSRRTDLALANLVATFSALFRAPPAKLAAKAEPKAEAAGRRAKPAPASKAPARVKRPAGAGKAAHASR